MMLRNTTIVALLMVLSANALAAELSIYSGRKAKFVKPLLQKFSEQTGIRINLKSGNASILLSRMSLEGSKTTADIYIGNDVGNLQRGSDYGLFHKIPESLVSAVPAKHRSPSNDWVGLSGRLRVLVVNTKSEIAKDINSIFDLADPKLKGKIGITYSSNESFIGGATSYLNIIGEKNNRKWLKGIKENAGRKLFKKHSKIVKAVAKGDKAVGLVNHYYALRHMNKHPDDPIRLVIPDQGKGQIGVAWNMSGIAVSRYSKHPELAEKLVAFLISEEEQKIFAEVNQEYPTRSGVPVAKGVPAVGSYRITETPIIEIGRQREKTVDEFHRLSMR